MNSMNPEQDSGEEIGHLNMFNGSPCSPDMYQFGNSNSIIRTRRRKSINEKEKRKCVICGEQASGFNFDRLTCESCKAFFRRNALKPKQKMKPCPDGGGCNISGNQRKHCPFCRLDKCFREGMKKDLILPPEKLEQRAKPKRKKFIENENSNELHPLTNLTSNSSVGSQDFYTHNSNPEVLNSPDNFCQNPINSSNSFNYKRELRLTIDNNITPEPIPLSNNWLKDLSLDDQEFISNLIKGVDKMKDPFLSQDHSDGETAKTLEEECNCIDTRIRKIIRLVKLLPCFLDMNKQMQLILLTEMNTYGKEKMELLDEIKQEEMNCIQNDTGETYFKDSLLGHGCDPILKLYLKNMEQELVSLKSRLVTIEDESRRRGGILDALVANVISRFQKQ